MLDFLHRHNYKVTRHITSNLLMVTLVFGMSVFTFGYEASTLNTIQAMTPFEQRFGDFIPEKKAFGFTSNKLAYMNSFPLLVYAVGVIVGAQIGERWGRRLVFIITNIVCMAGTIIVFTAKTYDQLLAGRMIVNFHVGMEAFLIPMFQAEIAPAAVRGSLTAIYGVNGVFAAFVASIITDLTSKIPNDNCWKIPVGIGLVFPTFSLFFWILIPESPRWLLRKGDYAKAVENMDYLYGAMPNFDAEKEAKFLQEALNTSETTGKWKDLVKGTNLRRTGNGLIASALAQLSGASFSNLYGTIFLKSLKVIDPFMATMVKRALLLVTAITFMFIIDKAGRRRLFLYMGFMQTAVLMVMGGLGTIAHPTLDINKGIVALTMMYPVFHFVSFGGPLQLTKTEIPHITLRDKSVMLFWLTANLCNFISTFTLPYLLQEPANLGSRVGLIYGSISALGLVWGWFFMPEMSKKSLEEIDEMFAAGVPAWKSRHWRGEHTAKITELENNGVIGDSESERNSIAKSDPAHMTQEKPSKV
ncbi:Hexose transporter [Colletotrichum higginsianum IMI 349063]|uniref:Hexose transporter n=3 Tax=Colletotrichum higginsianum TaxID=80884 RepID=A0A1B7XZY5_COLHI|nr:Hexose transporter [Colletotrichum higginsianum IMI 349063]OBR05309.1 Hexose transporter [Colletotrichum higginsianum IMI 349063]TIC94195.1 putative glucose transporter rco-3 [Colletotrichum higginsianum]